MRNLVLAQDIIYATNITNYKVANKLLKEASASPAAEYISFFLSSVPTEKGYSLRGRIISLTKKFIKDPNKFVIQLTDEEYAQINIKE